MSIIGSPICIGYKEPSSGTGSGSDSIGEYVVRVIDYDGTILKEEYLNEGDVFTLPDSPSNSGLTFQGWSCPLTITDNTVTISNNDLTIGAVYTTSSGATEFDIVLDDSSNLTVKINYDIESWPNVDWGDGTTSDQEQSTHTYSSVGSYTIKINDISQINDFCIGQSESAIDTKLTAVRVGSSVTTITYQAFYNCTALKTISIPNGVYIGASSAFNNCYNLQSIVLPNDGSEDMQQFADCHCLMYIAIPSKINYMGYETFKNCYSLKNITFPDYFIGIGQNSFSNCHSMTRISLSDFVSGIDDECFDSCYSVVEYNLTKVSGVIPLGSNCFNNINPVCKVKVTSSLYSTWVNATNWDALANYMVAV